MYSQRTKQEIKGLHSSGVASIYSLDEIMIWYKRLEYQWITQERKNTLLKTWDMRTLTIYSTHCVTPEFQHIRPSCSEHYYQRCFREERLRNVLKFCIRLTNVEAAKTSLVADLAVRIGIMIGMTTSSIPTRRN